jgi:fucose 4-O-acetylase-like acetyltransferase
MARRHPGAAGAVAARPADRWSAGRHLYLDNLKVVLIAAIIALHAIGSYAGKTEVWTYTELREVTLSPVTEVVLVVLALPFGLFLIALLFLISGLLTAPSVDHKGPARFARNRLVRLGIPFAAYVLVIQPASVFALEHPLGEAPRSYWAEFLGEERVLDTGPLWFVGVLLIYSLAYAGWVGVRGRRTPRPGAAIGVRHLAVAAAVVAPRLVRDSAGLPVRQ